MNEPIPNKIKTKFNNFGKDREDYYHWMRTNIQDESTPEYKNVLDYINQENEYTSKIMESTMDTQMKLVDEFNSTELDVYMSNPYYNYYTNYWYYVITKKDLEYPIYYRKYKTLDSEPELVVDGNSLAEGYKYYELGAMCISDDNKYFIYSYDDVARRQYKIVIQNRETGEYIPEIIENATSSFILLPDSKTLYYVLEDEVTLRACKIMKHIIGTSVDDDILIYQEDDEGYTVGVSKCLDVEMVFISSSSKENNEIRFINFNNLDMEPEIFLEREGEHFYDFDIRGDYYYIYTNYEAKNYRLIKCNKLDYRDKSKWVDVVPHDENIMLDGFNILHDYITISQTEKYKTKIKILHDDGEVDILDFKDDVSVLSLYSEQYKNIDILRYSYESMTTPDSIFEYNVKTKETKLMHQIKISGTFNSDDYITKREYVKSRDGVDIPVSYVYKKNITLKNSPMVLNGYGSYGYSYDPYFSRIHLSLLDRGIIIAIAHIRGGVELGTKWHDDGKMLNKKNTFNDFIDCAKYFIDSGITSPDKLIANGGSAGGLLMGVVANEAPELFNSIIADVPFVDVINTMLDETIPLTVGEYKEWGNPNEEEYYNYMLSYSPYDNIKKQDYPNMLVYSGLYDSQVQYWEPLKWVAKLREYRTNKNKMLILKMNLDTGHGYATNKWGYYFEVAFKYSFILKNLNMV